MRRHLLVPFLTAFSAVLSAQSQSQAPVVSPEVHPDNRVTFRFRATHAQQVSLTREGARELAMTKNEDGLWTVTTGPLEPDLYGYAFVADGVRLVDPSNPKLKPNLLTLQSVVHVRGPASLSWEVGNVPHGAIHHHFFKSAAVGDERDYYVYTPPAYDADGSKRYPVLYLLHGFSDDASAWTAVGRAHVILDNLIAQRKAQPMIVVMPLGYGTPADQPPQRSNDPKILLEIGRAFRSMFFTELMPHVEQTYRVAKNRNSTAVAGLSMGGAQSLQLGLNTLDRFAWVGAFSPAVGARAVTVPTAIGEEFSEVFPTLTATANRQLRLLWIGCGTEDFLLEGTRQFESWLRSRDVRHSAVETPGAHTWLIWRRYLTTFVSLLFRE